MNYKLVNEELRIFSCSVSDLTMQQAASFLEQWGRDAKIGQLTLFYEKETDSLVLNRDNKNYKEYLEIAEIYLELDDKKSEEFLECVSEGTKETIESLQRCKQRRKALQMLNILGYQYVSGCSGTEEYAVFKELKEKNKNENSLFFLLSNVFNYGFIKGKRAERAKKRK